MPRISQAAAVMLLALTAIATHGQTAKAGLWQTTSETTIGGMKQPQIPPETLAKMQAMGVKIPTPGGTTTRVKMCVTQESIDKYGGPQPQVQNGCEMTNIHRTGSGMTADLVCTGRMNGSGTLQASRTDAEHTTTNVHFSGTAQGHAMEWTMHGSSTYLGAACGDVQPGHPVVE